MRWIWLTLGVLAVAVGAVWTLQGFNIVGGSVMSGQGLFVALGLILIVIGITLIAVGTRTRRKRSA